MLSTARAHTHTHLSSSPPPCVWNASSVGQSLSSSARYSFTLPELTRGLFFHFSLPFSRSLSVSLFTVPWYDQRQLCDTERSIRETENIKPPQSNSQKKKRKKRLTQRDGGAHVKVCVCVLMYQCVCGKQMNKLTRRERRMTLSLPSARRWKVGRCPSEVRFCTDLKEEGRAWIRAAV